MGYCITYNPELKGRYPLQRKRKAQYKGYLVAFLVIVLVLSISADARMLVKEWVLPGDSVLTEAALSCLIQDVQEGTPVKEALTAFCLEIIENADIQK